MTQNRELCNECHKHTQVLMHICSWRACDVLICPSCWEAHHVMHELATPIRDIPFPYVFGYRKSIEQIYGLYKEDSSDGD